MMTGKNITWQPTTITKSDRQKLNNHKSCVLWFTGYSGSGKSTVANELDCLLYSLGIRSFVLDGDNFRHRLNKDLGFSKRDRIENVRRVGEVSKLFVESGQIVIAALISPYRHDRVLVRELFEEDEFIEVFIDCPLSVCEQRDPKGLYEKVRNGEISHFTGIDSPYERPIHPELTVNTDKHTVHEATQFIIQFLKNKGIIPRKA